MKNQSFSITHKSIQNKKHIIHATIMTPKNPKCAVQILHGMAEHKNRYFKLMEKLAQNDIMVVIHNHRGHGGTNNGHIGSIKLLIEDTLKVRTLIPKDLNVVLLGHSMGSIVQRSIMLKNEYESYIIVGTGLKNTFIDHLSFHLIRPFALIKPRSKSVFINAFAFYGYDKNFEGNVKNRWLQSNLQNVNQYNDDKLSYFYMSNYTYYDVLKHMIKLNKKRTLKHIKNNPNVLIISGDSDPFSNFGEDIHVLKQQLLPVCQNVDVSLYEGSRHEVLFDVSFEEVEARIIKWVRSIE